MKVWRLFRGVNFDGMYYTYFQLCMGNFTSVDLPSELPSEHRASLHPCTLYVVENSEYLIKPFSRTTDTTMTLWPSGLRR